jgi:antitoxin component YwqK of YwqJK toxin-antitoxin module
MIKQILLFLSFVSLCTVSFGQSSDEKILYVIDSIPVLKDPEAWNPIMQDDIAEISIIKNKDSLKLLGWADAGAIVYLFTKEYRNRPDNIKRVPSLKQMEMRNGVWYLHDYPYTGKYIDYYNSGKILDEGTLFEGKQDGELIVYYQNGNRKSTTWYKDGVRHGISNYYHTNGKLKETREFKDGRSSSIWKMYFINGQLESEKRLRRETAFDTSILYYSSGKVKQMRLVRNGIMMPDKKIDEVNFYSYRFYQSLRTGDLKEANKSFFKIWKTDSTSSDTYFKEGILMLRENRFDDAINAFNKALETEPFMRESLMNRALARINKYKFPHAKVSSKNSKQVLLTFEDLMAVPTAEQEKVCSDLNQAYYLGFTEINFRRIFSESILNYCLGKFNRQSN